MTSPLLPSDLGLDPAHFPSFREGQLDLSTQLAMTTSPHTFCNAPVGFGKSLAYLTPSLMFDLRTLILTPQKALQDQLMRDFGPGTGGGLVDVRGQSNYPCPSFRNCEVGAANDCPLRRTAIGSGAPRCPNLHAIDVARGSKRVVANNAWWMTQGRAQQTPSESGPPPGIGQFDLLVVDEGHRAHDTLADFCTITLIQREVEALCDTTCPSSQSSLSVWSEWARASYPRISGLIKSADSPRDKVRLRSIERDLVELAGVATDTTTRWIHQFDGKELVHKFTPVWAKAYAAPYLFQSSGKVLVTSATLLPNTHEYLGVKGSECEFVDVATTFPAENRPLIYCPSGISLGWKSTDSDIRIITSKYDQIMDLWAGYNMLLHTQSHALTERILKFSRNTKRIIVYGEDRPASECVALLKSRPNSGLIIAGPGLKEGFDLPYDSARAQIIAKMPIINTTSDPVGKARAESNPNYLMDQASIQLMQTVGRITRARDDVGYSYTADGRFGWVWREGRMPGSFREAIRWMNDGSVPGPPNALTRKVIQR